MEESCLLSPVISISAIEVHDSKLVALVAVMESGTRIYFSTNGGNRPNSLQIAHVRMPPGYTGTSPAQRPSKIRTGIYSRGELFQVGCVIQVASLMFFLSYSRYLLVDQFIRRMSRQIVVSELRPNSV